jgi:hypothetical protein
MQGPSNQLQRAYGELRSEQAAEGLMQPEKCRIYSPDAAQPAKTAFWRGVHQATGGLKVATLPEGI